MPAQVFSSASTAIANQVPRPGDQHKPNGTTTTNPFDESKPHINEYTAQEIATLQSRLNKRLGPEFISTRPGPGNQKIAYLSAEKAINLANEVFGFNGWSSSIQNIQIDFVDESPQSGKVSLGLSVVVRVTLKDGTYHEDIGYGGIENCKGKAIAFEKSKKEATTDALKRTLRNFGNVLGNCIYDKDYVTKVSKVKAVDGKFDVNELHRHPDFAPKIDGNVKPTLQNVPALNKAPSLEFEDSFDVSELDDIDFNESDLGHPDEVVLPAEPNQTGHQSIMHSGPSGVQTPSKPPQPRPAMGQMTGPATVQGRRLQNLNGISPGISAQPFIPSNRALNNPVQAVSTESRQPPSHGVSAQQAQPTTSSTAITAPAPATFYSARAAKEVDQNNMSYLPPNATTFNIHAESPSIRKTAGVDHTKSVPIRRETQRPDSPMPPNVVDPRVDSNRKIGMPGTTASGPTSRPGMSTSAYRPPTRHGSPALPSMNPNASAATNTSDRGLGTVKRPPLGDVSNVQHSVTSVTSDGIDAKRQKVSGVPGDEGTSGGIENSSRPADANIS